ncbi:MAG: glucose-1-phosphate thymidylyltransferase RfbA [Verrucomicrobiota bacterium]
MKNRKGIVLAGGAGTRLYPLTRVISKQLMPVYDKPMIYYPISVLMLSGIKEILVISTPHDLPNFKKLLGDGSSYGVEFSYAEQPKPEGLAQALVIADTFLNGAPSCLVLGDNLFYSESLSEILSRASSKEIGSTIFGYRVADPKAYGVVEFDSNNKVISLEEKPEDPKSRFAVPGLYFYDEHASKYASQLKPSKRGELEITDLNRVYLDRGELNVELLGRGSAWLDTGTHDALLQAANFVQAIEHRQGLQIACLEEIALDQGWLTPDELRNQLGSLGKTGYADYLKGRLDDILVK